jgi:hypothetical protein
MQVAFEPSNESNSPLYNPLEPNVNGLPVPIEASIMPSYAHPIIDPEVDDVRMVDNPLGPVYDSTNPVDIGFEIIDIYRSDRFKQPNNTVRRRCKKPSKYQTSRAKKFGPFVTLGEMGLAAWRASSPIPRRAWDNLVGMIRAGLIKLSDFRSDRTFRRRVDGYPLLQQYSYRGPDGKFITFFMLADILERIVVLQRCLYPKVPLSRLFKRPTNPRNASEFMHGRYARSSPLLTKSYITSTDGVKMHLGSLVELHLDNDMKTPVRYAKLSSIFEVPPKGLVTTEDTIYGCSLMLYYSKSELKNANITLRVSDAVTAVIDRTRGKPIGKWRTAELVLSDEEIFPLPDEVKTLQLAQNVSITTLSIFNRL